MIIDASVILRAFMPDEAQAEAQQVIADYISGRVNLIAPSLLIYELTNVIRQAERRQRISREQAGAILRSIEGLDIQLEPVSSQIMLDLARQFDRTAYDAAYLALAQTTRQPLLTGDIRLYNAVHSQLAWVIWITDYKSPLIE